MKHRSSSEPWIFTSLYSYSSLSDDRGDWNEGEVELLNKTTPDLTLGAHLDVRSRSAGTDELYGVLASYRVAPQVEAHAAARYAPSPAFSARQTYTAGGEWRAFTPVSLLFDYQWMAFAAGRVHQLKPAVTFWINDIGDHTANIGMLLALENCFQSRFFL